MRKIAAWIVFGLLIILLYRVDSHGWLRVNFVDEQDNFVVANNILEGNKVYTNIFSHHQPLTYVLSGLVQNVLEPNTIQSLVKQHRMTVTIWSTVWMFFLTWRFGWGMAGAVMLLELIKRVYLGNMFLAESLVVWPMVYLTAGFLKNEKLIKGEAFFIGILLAGVALSLAPMWPLVGVIGLGWITRWRDKTNKIVAMLIGGSLLTVAIFYFIDIGGYVRDAILINQKFYISVAGGDNLAVSFLKAIMTPFMYLTNGINLAEVLVVKILLLFLLGELIYLLIKRKFGLVAWIWIILALANLRNFELEKLYYDGFHLLIWIGLATTIPFLFLKKRGWVLSWGLLIVLMSQNRNLILKAPNYSEDFEIYYSRIFNMSEAIRLTKNNDDKLLAMPDEVLGYWQAEILPEGRFIFFYKWMSNVTELKKEQLANFEARPEYLIIKGREKLDIGKYLEEYQNFRYRRGENSEFYIRSDVYKSFDQKKIDKLNYYGLEEI